MIITDKNSQYTMTFSDLIAPNGTRYMFISTHDTVYNGIRHTLILETAKVIALYRFLEKWIKSPLTIAKGE